MVVREQDHEGNPEDVALVSDEVRNELDGLGEDKPDQPDDEDELEGVHIVVGDDLVEDRGEDAIPEEGGSLPLGNVDRIETPKVAPVPVIGGGHDSEVTSPVSSGPAEALIKKAVAVDLESGLDASTGVKL